MRLISIALGLVALLVAGSLGWKSYLYFKTAPVLNSARTKLVPTKFVPVPLKEIRRVNLGYATVSLPVFVTGDPTAFGGSFISVGDKTHGSVGFMSPTKFTTLAADPAIKQMEQWTGKPLGNIFELEKIAMEVQPFSSLGQFLAMGRRQAGAKTAALLLKGISVLADTKSVEIYEAKNLGATVQVKNDGWIVVAVYDLQHETIQGIHIRMRTDAAAHEVVSALLSDYTMPLQDDSDDALRRLIEEAKIPPTPPPDTVK